MTDKIQALRGVLGGDGSPADVWIATMSNQRELLLRVFITSPVLSSTETLRREQTIHQTTQCPHLVGCWSPDGPVGFRALVNALRAAGVSEPEDKLIRSIVYSFHGLANRPALTDPRPITPGERALVPRNYETFEFGIMGASTLPQGTVLWSEFMRAPGEHTLHQLLFQAATIYHALAVADATPSRDSLLYVVPLPATARCHCRVPGSDATFWASHQLQLQLAFEPRANSPRNELVRSPEPHRFAEAVGPHLRGADLGEFVSLVAREPKDETALVESLRTGKPPTADQCASYPVLVSRMLAKWPEALSEQHP